MYLIYFLMKSYLVFLIAVMLVYIFRHLLFSVNRMSAEPTVFYQDIMDSQLPKISVLVPMHNEEMVAKNILDMLITTFYPNDKLEIIPIDDHSTDLTGTILDDYAARFSIIKPFHRHSGRRGKPSALNEAIKNAAGDIIVVFDADYLPPKGILRDIVITFKDPEIGAVMGRVIPENSQKNILTKLLSLERSAGYQVDQQARQNLGLIPQYGGTVGGFRKSVFLALGGFDPDILTEDTELTFKLIVNGWKVVYNNRVECYEEVPEDWDVRSRQIRRWARGHTQVMFKYLMPVLKSGYITLWGKIDGFLLLCIYIVPLIIIIGIIDALACFFMGQMQILENIFFFLAVAGFNLFGNFAPFYQIGTASIIDGFTYRVRLLPFVIFSYLFNIYYTAGGAIDAILDQFYKREIVWEKTERFRQP